MKFEEGHRLLFSGGEPYPLLDVSILDEETSSERTDALMERFGGMYIGINVGANLPVRMRAVFSNGDRPSYACPTADLDPMLGLIKAVVEGSTHADKIKGFVLSNIIPPLFRYQDPLTTTGNTVNYGCSCPKCDESVGLDDLGDRLALMNLRPLEADYEKNSFARDVWVWAMASSVLDDYQDLLADRILGYERILGQLADLPGERYLIYSEDDYPDSDLQVNGYDELSRSMFGISDDILAHVDGLIVSPSFGMINDERHIPLFEADDIATFIQMRYIELKSKFMIDSIFPAEVMVHVLKG